MRELSTPPLVLLIEDVDSPFILGERGETLQMLVLGDMTLAASTYPEAPHVAAKWSGKRLVSEAPTRRGGSLETGYRLAAEGRELAVKLTHDGPEGTPGLSLERVYVRDEGDEQPRRESSTDRVEGSGRAVADWPRARLVTFATAPPCARPRGATAGRAPAARSA